MEERVFSRNVAIVTYHGVTISNAEIERVCKEETEYWESKGKKLHQVRFEKGENDNELVVTSYPKTKITRIRRIKGYLSNVNNFNSAKKAEMESRVAHVKEGEK